MTKYFCAVTRDKATTSVALHPDTGEELASLYEEEQYFIRDTEAEVAQLLRLFNARTDVVTVCIGIVMEEVSNGRF